MGTVEGAIAMPFTTLHSPFETALRTLVVLCHTFPQGFDVGELAVLDYLLVHSGDLDGPISLHPATPYRSGEAIVLGDLVERGLHLLVSRGLAEVEFGDDGITFRALDLGAAFLDALQSPYVKELRDRANWLATLLEDQPAAAISARVSNQLLNWGGEFEREALLREAYE